jgi:hypothetical protein
MKAIFTCLFLFVACCVFANNIQLQKVALSDTNRAAKTVNIKMNISWEHSWRDGVNWDAAWIIIKYKEPKDSVWKWKHAQLSVTGNNTGTAAGVKIVVPADRTGAFFYRSEAGSGNIGSDNVKLLWNYGVAGVSSIDSVEVRVFATEMVYVPEGNYCLGDGNGTAASINSFQMKKAPYNFALISDKWSPLINTGGQFSSTPGPLDPISDDDAIVFNSGFRISGANGLDINDDKIADYPNFPTGYKGFYCMKYKVTQGQYTDFLNTIAVNDTTANVINSFNGNAMVSRNLQAALNGLGDDLFNTSTVSNRNSILFDPVQAKFTVSRPDRAYAKMDMNKGFSFSEWFGLRPMSELEFEKACRGPLPPYYSPGSAEKAWGSDAALFGGSSTGSLTLSGPENGTEYFTNYNIDKRDLDPTSGMVGGDGGPGPYRVGIFATDTSSRISSGASYYGIMDLSKITSEMVVSVGNPVLRSFNYASFGKGVLSAVGKNYSFATLYTPPSLTMFRHSTVSARFTSIGNNGFRAVRLAPSDN